MLSSRPDLVPKDVVLELESLVDAVPAFPTYMAFETIAAEGSDSPLNLVSLIDGSSVPIAAGR